MHCGEPVIALRTFKERFLDQAKASVFNNQKQVSQRPGLRDIALLFMPDRFPESGAKSAQ